MCSKTLSNSVVWGQLKNSGVGTVRGPPSFIVPLVSQNTLLVPSSVSTNSISLPPGSLAVERLPDIISGGKSSLRQSSGVPTQSLLSQDGPIF